MVAYELCLLLETILAFSLTCAICFVQNTCLKGSRATGGRRGKISTEESNEKTAPRSEEAFNAMKSQELYRRKISSVESYDSHEAGRKGPKVDVGRARKSKEVRKPKEKPNVVKVSRLRSKVEPDNRASKKQSKVPPAPNRVKAIGIAMDEDLEDGTYEDVNIIGR